MSYPSTNSQGDEPLPRLIYYTAQHIKNLAEKLLKPHNLTIEQVQPLKILAATSGLTQRQIGDECNKSAANLTRILDRLQNKTLIERRSNPADRRTSLVFLTSQGESLVRDVSEILTSFAEKSTQGISSKDQAIFRSTLEKITSNLQHIELHNPTTTAQKER